MSKQVTTQQLLGGRQHYSILDGLRGIAAFAVVVFHFMEWIRPDPSKNFIGHGYLAVDFFFCLSGFVIGYAYDTRVREIGLIEFFKSRLIRLHPLVILGGILGFICLFLDPFSTTSTPSGGQLALILLFTLLLIPFPVMESRFNNNFGLNAPAWSLFWEYIANIIYALVLCRLKRLPLAIFTGIALVALSYVAISSGRLVGGWDDITFWHGGARVAFSFSAGLLIYRLNLIIKSRVSFIVLSILLLGAFLAPTFSFNGFVELAIVAIYFPLLIAFGAGSVPSERMKKICDLSGRISYPLYMTHYAVIWIFGSYYTKYKPSDGEVTAIVIIALACLVLFAYAVLKLYDEPLRRYLSNKRIAKEKN